MDESLPPLPPPMPSLDELRKIQASKSRSHALPKNGNLKGICQAKPPTRKKARKVLLSSSFFEDSEPVRSTSSLGKPPSILDRGISGEPLLLLSSRLVSNELPSSMDRFISSEHLPPPLNCHAFTDAQLSPSDRPISDKFQPPLSDESMQEQDLVSSTPNAAGGFFPEFFPDISKSNWPSPVLTSQPQSKNQPSTPCSRKHVPNPPQGKHQQRPARRNTKAQNLLFQERQKRIASSDPKNAITVEEYKMRTEEQPIEPWIPSLELTQHDKLILLSPAEWATDSIINAAQTLLRKANPQMPGLQSVAKGLTMAFDIEPGEFVRTGSQYQP